MQPLPAYWEEGFMERLGFNARFHPDVLRCWRSQSSSPINLLLLRAVLHRRWPRLKVRPKEQ